MLANIEQLLKQKGPMTAAMIARQLKASESAIEGMLALLISRGRISKRDQSACEGSCCSSSSAVALYEWQGKNSLPLTQVK